MRIAQQPAASEPQARPRAAARACSSGWLMGRSSKLAAEVYGVSPACTVRISLSSGSCRPGAVDAAPSFSSGRSGAAAGAAASPPAALSAAPAAPLSAPAAPLLAPPPAVPFVALALPPAAPSVVPSAAPRASTCARANSFRWPEGGVSAVSREAAGGSGQAAGRHLDRAEAVRQARHVVRAGRHVLKAGRRVCARAPAHSAAWSPECNGSRVAALGLGGVHRRRLPGLMAQPALRGPRHQPTSPLPSPSPAQSRASEHTTRSGAQASTRAGQALLICQQ